MITLASKSLQTHIEKKAEEMGAYQYCKFLFISFINLLLIFLMAEVIFNAKQRPWATSWLQVGQ